MLEFSDAPYQFFAPQPSRPVMAFSRHLNRFLLRYDLGVHQKEITGEFDAVRDLCRSGARVMFTPNHPTRTDPQFMADVQRQLGCHTSFMAAYDVFLEGRLQGWMMQKNGCFSVDRDGNDRKAMTTAIDILKSGESGLTVFPEGNVYQLNDRVTPLLDGPAFIAAKAQQALVDEEVWVVPVSIKYTYLEDVSKQAWQSLRKVANHAGFSGALHDHRPVDSVFSLGSHLVSKLVEKTTSDRVELDWRCPVAVKADLKQIMRKVTAKLESDLGIDSTSTESLTNRIRKIRSKIHQVRSDVSRKNQKVKQQYQQLSDQAHFVMRLLNYRFSYLSEKPSLDRFVETVDRIREDHFSKSFRPLGPRKAMAKIGEPISMRDMMADSGRNIRPVLSKVTDKIEHSIQEGIDHLNLENREIGGQLIA